MTQTLNFATKFWWKSQVLNFNKMCVTLHWTDAEVIRSHLYTQLNGDQCGSNLNTETILRSKSRVCNFKWCEHWCAGHGSRAVQGMNCLLSHGSWVRIPFTAWMVGVCVCVCVCVCARAFILCLCCGLATSWSLVQRDLETKKGPVPTRAAEPFKKKKKYNGVESDIR
jgi:hypothetical protein